MVESDINKLTKPNHYITSVNVESEQRREQAGELDDAIRHQVEEKIEERLRKLVNEKIQAWYNSHIERNSAQLEKEAERIFSMIVEGRSTGTTIENEPKSVAKRMVSEMEFK